MTLPVKKFDLGKLLALDNVNYSMIEMDNYVCELCVWVGNLEKYKNTKRFYNNQNLEREINNGDFVHETIKSLKLIKADKTAEILEIAIEHFF